MKNLYMAVAVAIQFVSLIFVAKLDAAQAYLPSIFILLLGILHLLPERKT
jgi:hypothetical protein